MADEDYVGARAVDRGFASALADWLKDVPENRAAEAEALFMTALDEAGGDRDEALRLAKRALEAADRG